MGTPGPSEGDPGASARREHERRRRRREAQTRARHPHIGGLLLALGEPPAHERTWATGAEGERMVAEALARRCPDVAVLHDRALAQGRANIDHIAIAPTGVWVIDTKRYKGTIKVAGPLFGSPRLIIAGRDETKLVAGLRGQVAAVREQVAAILPGTTVHGAFCFVEGDLAGWRTQSIDGLPLLYRRSLVKRLKADGALGTASIAALREALAICFPPA